MSLDSLNHLFRTTDVNPIWPPIDDFFQKYSVKVVSHHLDAFFVFSAGQPQLEVKIVCVMKLGTQIVHFVEKIQVSYEARPIELLLIVE